MSAANEALMRELYARTHEAEARVRELTEALRAIQQTRQDDGLPSGLWRECLQIADRALAAGETPSEVS
jgi:hypothetical protein